MGSFANEPIKLNSFFLDALLSNNNQQNLIKCFTIFCFIMKIYFKLIRLIGFEITQKICSIREILVI